MFVWGPQKRGYFSVPKSKRHGFLATLGSNQSSFWLKSNKPVGFFHTMYIFWKNKLDSHIPLAKSYIQFFNLEKKYNSRNGKTFGRKMDKSTFQFTFNPIKHWNRFHENFSWKLISRKNKPRVWTWFQPFLLPCRLLESSQVEQE